MEKPATPAPAAPRAAPPRRSFIMRLAWTGCGCLMVPLVPLLVPLLLLFIIFLPFIGPILPVERLLTNFDPRQHAGPLAALVTNQPMRGRLHAEQESKPNRTLIVASPNGVFRVPAGRWILTGYEAEAVDRKGRLWSLFSDLRTSPPRVLDLTPGSTTPLAVGGPYRQDLTAKVQKTGRLGEDHAFVRYTLVDGQGRPTRYWFDQYELTPQAFLYQGAGDPVVANFYVELDDSGYHHEVPLPAKLLDSATTFGCALTMRVMDCPFTIEGRDCCLVDRGQSQKKSRSK